jgi:hypothetical protein
VIRFWIRHIAFCLRLFWVAIIQRGGKQKRYWPLLWTTRSRCASQKHKPAILPKTGVAHNAARAPVDGARKHRSSSPGHHHNGTHRFVEFVCLNQTKDISHMLLLPSLRGFLPHSLPFRCLSSAPVKQCRGKKSATVDHRGGSGGGERLPLRPRYRPCASTLPTSFLKKKKKTLLMLIEPFPLCCCLRGCFLSGRRGELFDGWSSARAFSDVSPSPVSAFLPIIHIHPPTHTQTHTHTGKSQRTQ